MAIIRLATSADAKQLLDIYAPYIANTSITFETETPSVQDFAKRIDTYLENWPWLVCEVNGTIAGYAYAGRYRERVAYQWCVESSVYIHDDFFKKGIAEALYSALFEILKKQRYNNVYAVINLPNDRSVALHEKMGFEYFATYKNVGYKLGKWKNVGWWQHIINEYKNEPPAPIKFSEMNKDFLKALFKSTESKIRQ
ncbi:MAG: arsinothricin resistance N-acetyltransferase ArsN1 family B [Chitinophagaceae bacterium]